LPCCFCPLCHLHSSPTRRSSDLLFVIKWPTLRTNMSTRPDNVTFSPFGPVYSRSGFNVRVTSFPPFSNLALRSPLFSPSQLRYRSEEHTSELQSRFDLVCRLLLA